jgi:hypothetical protein
MSGSLEAKIIRIEFDRGETGRIYATSPDIKGLMIGRRSLEELENALPQAITEMYAACGLRVVVSRVARDDHAKHDTWVAFPAEIARQALDAAALV